MAASASLHHPDQQRWWNARYCEARGSHAMSGCATSLDQRCSHPIASSGVQISTRTTGNHANITSLTSPEAQPEEVALEQVQEPLFVFAKHLPEA